MGGIMRLQSSQTKDLRIFQTGGVQLSPDDCRFIQNNDILYISMGEEFDDSSNFAVFKLINVLGQGGFGKVYYAKNRLSKDFVAIKMIDGSQIRSVKDIELIYKEIHILMGLNHKNILKIFNCYNFSAEKQIALILEYLGGGNLREYIDQKGFLQEDEAKFLFSQICDAMQYCHQEKVIHRDLKLENLMFADQENKTLKVVDFGISGSSNTINIEYTEAGSLRYLAPEVITRSAPAHPSIDIWAMGCILYWMIHGNPPFNGMTKEEIQHQIIKGDYQFDSQVKARVSESIIDLIQKMLHLNFQERINISDICQHPWMTLQREDLEIQQEQARELKYQLQELEQEKQRQREREEKLALQKQLIKRHTLKGLTFIPQQISKDSKPPVVKDQNIILKSSASRNQSLEKQSSFQSPLPTANYKPRKSVLDTLNRPPLAGGGSNYKESNIRKISQDQKNDNQ